MNFRNIFRPLNRLLKGLGTVFTTLKFLLQMAFKKRQLALSPDNPNKDLVEAADFIFDLTDSYKAAKADGKIDLRDIPEFLDDLFQAPEAVEGLKNVWPNYKASTPAQREEVLAHFRDRFDLEDDGLESLIEDGVGQLQGMATYAARVSKYVRAHRA